MKRLIQWISRSRKKVDPTTIEDSKWCTGAKSKLLLNWLLSKETQEELREEWNKPSYKGLKGYHYSQKEHTWIAWDNSTGDCWVEEFNSHQKCIKYLNGVDPEKLLD